MYPFYLHDYKTTIWWSAKCGCSTLKYLIYNIILNINPTDFHKDTYFDFDSKYLNYVNILIVRNPIDRIISSYLDKYWEYNFIYNLNKPDMTFEEFINILFNEYENNNIEPQNKVSNNHHNTPQFSERFNELHDYTKQNFPEYFFHYIYKLEEFNIQEFMKKHFNIDYDKNVQWNIGKQNKKLSIPDAYKIKYNELKKNIPKYECFLTEDIIKKIKKIYEKDYFYLEINKIEYLGPVVPLNHVSTLDHIDQELTIEQVVSLLKLEPVDPLLTVEPVDPLLKLEPVDPLLKLEPVDPLLKLEPVDPLLTVEPVDPLLKLEPVDPLLKLEPVDPLLKLEPVDPLLKLEPVDPLLKLEPVDPLLKLEPVDPLLKLEPVDPLLTVEPVDPLLTVEPVDPLLTVEPVDPLLKLDCV
jgi:hypothetical protein